MGLFTMKVHLESERVPFMYPERGRLQVEDPVSIGMGVLGTGDTREGKRAVGGSDMAANASAKGLKTTRTIRATAN
jgi:hypothetical protein